MKYKILILTIMIFLIPKDTQASFAGTSPRQSANCTTGINCGLVGHWTFDGKDIVNGAIKDVSGNGNNGNTVSIASSTFYVPGKIGQAVNFDGVDDYVDVQNSSSLNPTGSMSWGGWVNQKSINLVNQSFVNKITAGSLGYMLYNSSGAGSTQRCFAYGLTPNQVVDPLAVSANRWTHYMCIYNGSTLSIYRNGILAGSSSVTGSITHTTNVLNIGKYGDSGAKFSGAVDDIRVYNRALSAQEIQQLYSMGAATKVATSKPVSSTCVSDINCGLVGYWTFDGKDIVNGVIKDVSGNGNNGNPSGIASSTFYTPGKMGQGVRFDGVNDYVNVPDNSSIKPTGPMSWGGWTYRFSNGANQSPMSKITTSTSGYMMYSGISSAQQCYGYGLTPVLVQDTLIIPKNTWVHYMCVYDGSTLKIYRNGVLGNSTSVTGSITHTTNDLNIGAYGTSRYDGKVDDMRVYNRALSAQEVQQLYSMGSATKVGVSSSATSTPACSTGLSCGLVGYWTFDGKNMVNGAVRDMSGRGGTGYLSGISTSTFYAPGKIGQGGNFDGINSYAEVGTSAAPSSAITISAWVYWNGGSNYPAILCRTSAFDEATAKYCFYIKLGTGGVGQLSFSMGGGKVTQTTLLVPQKKWTFVSVVRSAGSTTATLYMNNASLVIGGTGGSGDYADPTYSSEQARIGTFFTGASQGRFPGIIDDVRIYSRALSTQEIQQLYSQSR